MSTIMTSIRIQDAMTPAFHSMNTALNIVLNSFETLQNASSKAVDTASIQQARQELANANVTIQQVENEIKRVNDESNKMPNGFNKANISASQLMQTLMSFSLVNKAINLVTGQIGSALNRMDTMNNFPKVMSNLGISAEQSKASISMLSEKLKGIPTTLDSAATSVQRLTSANGNIAASTRMFLALNNAILAGGGSTQTQQAAMEQLTQAYTKGKPDMFEWRSAMTAMPAQLNQVATAMGYINASALGDALRNGKESMNEFMNTFIKLNENGVNGFQSFEEQAKNATGGFNTSIANMKSAVTRGVGSVIGSINEGLTKAGFGTIQSNIQRLGSGIEKILSKIGNIFSAVIIYTSPIIDFIQQVAEFIGNNWGIIEPIILGIVAALGLYNGALLVYNTIQGISAAITTAKTIATTVHSAALMMSTGATFAATAAQYGFNAALLACPLTWIVVAIIAIVVAIYVLVAAFNKLTGSSVSATGIIMSIMYTMAAYIYNRVIVPLWNAFAAIANFLGNVFNDPATATKVLFYDLADTVLGYIETMAKGIEDVINKIPKVHVDLTSGLGNFRNQLQQAAKEAKDAGQWEEIVSKIDFWDMSDAAAAGYSKGVQVESGVSNAFNGNIAKSVTGAGLDMDNLMNGVNQIGGNTDDISKKMDVTEEDLQYLRDIAERETINRFTTAEIKVDMTNQNNINSELDIDGIIDIMGEKLEERLETIAEGVYT